MTCDATSSVAWTQTKGLMEIGMRQKLKLITDSLEHDEEKVS